jgi:hypothetical protein
MRLTVERRHDTPSFSGLAEDAFEAKAMVSG